MAPWVDVVSSPAAEALVADSEDEGGDEGDVSFGGRSPLAVLKLLIEAIFVAAVVVSTKRCSGVNVSFGGISPLAVLKLLIVAIFVAAVVVSTKRCSGINVSFGGISPLAV